MAYIDPDDSSQKTLERLQGFTSLERPFYTSAEIFEQEQERVVARQWMIFGHVSALPNPRDIEVRQLGAESVVVTRDADGVLRGFFNVCRHRGSQICDQGKVMKRLICPYHQWSYGFDGKLLAAPSMRDGVDMDYAAFGLHPVHLEVWNGFIFVSLGKVPPSRSVAEGLAGAQEIVDIYELEHLRQAHHVEYRVECNWKLLMENFLECYHCKVSHPELCAVSDMSEDAFEGDDLALAPTGFNFGAIPVLDGVVSHTITGHAATRRPLGRIVDQEKLPPIVGIVLNPTMSAIQIYSDYVITHRILPVSAEKTILRCDWYVHPDAKEGRDYDLANLLSLWEKTNEQDNELSERNQRGVNSRRFMPGPNSVQREPAIHGALSLYKSLMAEAVPGSA